MRAALLKLLGAAVILVLYSAVWSVRADENARLDCANQTFIAAAKDALEAGFQPDSTSAKVTVEFVIPGGMAEWGGGKTYCSGTAVTNMGTLAIVYRGVRIQGHPLILAASKGHLSDLMQYD